MCSPEAQVIMTVASTVMNYQNQKNVAKQHAADNKVAMGHYNEAYLYDLSKIDNESGNAVREKALEEFKIKQKKSLDIATALNLGFGNPLRAVQSVGGVADNDLNYVGFQFSKDMTTLQHQEQESYAHMIKGYSSLTRPDQPSLLGTTMQIASAGINYAVEDNKNRNNGVYKRKKKS
jgi:hypothetical protein